MMAKPKAKKTKKMTTAKAKKVKKGYPIITLDSPNSDVIEVIDGIYGFLDELIQVECVESGRGKRRLRYITDELKERLNLWNLSDKISSGQLASISHLFPPDMLSYLDEVCDWLEYKSNRFYKSVWRRYEKLNKLIENVNNILEEATTDTSKRGKAWLMFGELRKAVSELNSKLNETKQDLLVAPKDNHKLTEIPPIKVKGLWNVKGGSLEKLRKIDSNPNRGGIIGTKKEKDRLKHYLTKHRKRPDIADTLYWDDGWIKTKMAPGRMFT